MGRAVRCRRRWRRYGPGIATSWGETVNEAKAWLSGGAGAGGHAEAGKGIGPVPSFPRVVVVYAYRPSGKINGTSALYPAHRATGMNEFQRRIIRRYT